MSIDRPRLLIADDEGLARRLLRQYASRADVEIVRECADTPSVAAALDECRVDGALLDIRMPGPDLFEVLGEAARRHPLPPLIFATAHDAYAVRAFDLNAVDYLVKPIAEPRFAAAIARLRDRQSAAQEGAAVQRVLRDLGSRPDRLLVPAGRRIVPIAVADIEWIQAEANYARIHAGGQSYLVSRTLGELEARLDATEFLRVHRSAIVRLDRIADVQPIGSSRYRLRLTDGTALIVSRSRADALKRLML